MAGRVDHGGIAAGREDEMVHRERDKDERDKKRLGFRDVIRLVTIGLAVVAVVQELRRPPEEREWNGVVVGCVPYDFRIPTVARFKERVWAPESEHLINPRVFGVGWTVNVGRAVDLVWRRIQAAR
jgi:hypothetical protein